MRALRMAGAAAAWLLASDPTLGAAPVPAPLAVGLNEAVSLPEAPEIAAAPQVADRLLPPLAAEGLRRQLAREDHRLTNPAIDPAAERFIVYVPPTRPAAGYGLLVFVPPWRTARLPAGWAQSLDRAGMIFVSAENSGNDQSVAARRAPLALIGYANVARRFPIDPARVYVGGFSGGSRVALRLALAYPDIFRGALLNAGSDAIGVSPIHLPSPELMSLFQTRSRIVEVTGSDDPGSLALDLASQSSFRKWCVPGVQAKVTPWAAHGAADAAAFGWALTALTGPAPAADEAALSACRAARAHDVEAALAQAKALVDAGQAAAARRELLAIDNSLGGLAAPASVALADRCRCGIFPP